MNNFVLNPNCSEIVVRLEGILNKEEAKEKLSEIGIIEVDLPGYGYKGGVRKNALIDVFNEYSPGDPIDNTPWLRSDPIRESIMAIFINDCAGKMNFSIVDKIANNLRVSIYPYDGGGLYNLKSWVKDGKPGSKHPLNNDYLTYRMKVILENIDKLPKNIALRTLKEFLLVDNRKGYKELEKFNSIVNSIFEEEEN